MSEDRFWFADVSDPEDAVEGSPYQPFIQTAGGCFPLPLWFATEQECRDWIAEYVVGAGLEDA